VKQERLDLQVLLVLLALQVLRVLLARLALSVLPGQLDLRALQGTPGQSALQVQLALIRLFPARPGLQVRLVQQVSLVLLDQLEQLARLEIPDPRGQLALQV